MTYDLWCGGEGGSSGGAWLGSGDASKGVLRGGALPASLPLPRGAASGLKGEEAAEGGMQECLLKGYTRTCDLVPLLRLLLPKVDEQRHSYGLKEHSLAL